MAKNTPELPKVKWYKTALFPWLIIICLAYGSAMLITGWFLAKSDNNRVTGEASTLIQPIVKDLKDVK